VLSSLLLLALSLGDGDLVEDFEGAGSEAWERLVSDTHPPYNIIERVEDPARAKSGRQYLHFRTMGGFTGVRRSSRHPWPAEPGRPYRASVWVRLSGTHRNAAFLSLTWVDAAGEVLAEQRSAPLTNAAEWTELVLEVPTSPAGAAGVRPGLHFEGPDVRGLCDFDLLEVSPAETIEVRPAGRKRASFHSGDYPRFLLRPAGLPPGVHTLTATLTAPDGKALTRTATIDVPAQASVAVDFPPLPQGLYSLLAAVDQRAAKRRIAVMVGLPGATSDDEATAPRPAPSGEGAATTLRAYLLDPRRPFAPEGGLFEADGTPKAAYYELQIADAVLAGSEPLPDPGLFPPDVRVAAFRKGTSIGFALWTETDNLRLSPGMNEGAMVQPLTGALRPLSRDEELVLSPVPTFILGVDPILADLRLELSTTELPFQLNPSRLMLRLRNRSRGDAASDVALSLGPLPAGWRTSFRPVRLPALAPGAIREEALDLIVPATESERPVELTFTVRFTARERELSVHFVRRVLLKSPIRIETVSGAAKVLRVRVVNGSDRAMTLSVRSRVPGLPEGLDVIPDLAPGSGSRTLEFPARESGSAEIFVRETGGERALARRVLPLP
jgi:hypothetical protein